jgi:hypothetical protein
MTNKDQHNMKILQSKESLSHWHTTNIMTVQQHTIYCTKNGSKIYLMNLKLFHNHRNMSIKKLLKIETTLVSRLNCLDSKKSKKLRNNLFLYLKIIVIKLFSS